MKLEVGARVRFRRWTGTVAVVLADGAVEVDLDNGYWTRTTLKHLVRLFDQQKER